MKQLARNFKQLFLIGLTLFLGACAGTPQATVSLAREIFIEDELKVGITYIPPKGEATTHIYGADCLLCYVVAAALTSELDDHLEPTINSDELFAMKELVLSEYVQRSKRTEFVTLPAPIENLEDFNGELGFAKKDFRPLKKSLGLDILVVLKITYHGAYRNFSNYIPTGDPQGYVAGVLYSVDLDSNAYVQYMAIDEKVQPSGAWDEPPSFPSVTTSYYQAIENTKQNIKDAL